MTTLGQTAPVQLTVNYDALLTTTLMAYRKVMVDNIFKANAYLAALRELGGIDYQNGGERIARLLMYEDNKTVKSYSGYEQLDTTPQEGMTTAFFPWKEVAGTISISRKEERQNSGEAAILNLLKQKILQAEMSLKAKVNSMMVQGTVSSGTFVPGNNAKDLFPLGMLLAKNNNVDPTSGGNVGEIAKATYSWWRHRTAVADSATKDTGNDFAMAVTTYKGLKAAFYRMYNFCTRGADGSPPNLVLCDQITYETYENSLDQSKQYTDSRMASMGFDAIKLKGAMMVWDELVPDIDAGKLPGESGYAGTAFFENTKYSQLIIDQETDFVTTPFIEPENQTVKTAKILFMGNRAISNSRKCGVIYAIDQTIAA